MDPLPEIDDITAKEIVHLVVSVDALDDLALRGLRTDEDAVRDRIHQVTQLFLLLLHLINLVKELRLRLDIVVDGELEAGDDRSQNRQTLQSVRYVIECDSMRHEHYKGESVDGESRDRRFKPARRRELNVDQVNEGYQMNLSLSIVAIKMVEDIGAVQN